MATADQLRKSIEPGSIPHGDRAGLEQNLGELPSTGAAAAAGPAAGGSPVSGADPLGAITSGEINPGGQNVPLTDGLSVGPGQGGPADIPSEKNQRLQILAQASRSPQIRAAARLALLSHEPEQL